MLIADVLNSEATLNNFDVVKTVDFIAGYTFRLVIRLKQPQHPTKLRYVAASGATLTASLPKKNGNSLQLSMTPLPDDRSIWSVTVSDTDSEDLMSGNFTFVLTEGSAVTSGWVENGLALVITGSC